MSQMATAKLRCEFDRYVGWRINRAVIQWLRAHGKTYVYEAVHEEMREKIPIIMCIDVEPDGFFIDRDCPSAWAGYEEVYKFFRQLRPHLSFKTLSPAHFTWVFRLDPQIGETYGSPAWGITHYERYVDDFMANGDELGLHPHDYRWEPSLQSWVIDHGNQAWCNHCVQVAFDGFRSIFNRDCQTFRYGDRWMNDETLHLVERLGARFDLTLEPGQAAKAATYPDRPFTGSLPDYSSVPLAPFRPSKDDFRKPDPARKDGIWMIPISSADLYGGMRFHRNGGKQSETGSHYQTLNMRYQPAFFGPALDFLLKTLEKPYLTFVIRSDIGTSSKLMKIMQDNFNYVLSHRFVQRFVFCTPAEAMTLLGYQ
jgi:hypothetical protein